MLPSSLAKLAISFNVENKSIFPYNFVNNSNIPLNYEGKVPSFNQFTNISVLDYHLYLQDFNTKSWNLRDETIKYCEQDVRTLYQMINKFNMEIFTQFRVDLLKYSTLPSLALGFIELSS